MRTRNVPLRDPSFFRWPAIGLAILAFAIVAGAIIH